MKVTIDIPLRTLASLVGVNKDTISKRIKKGEIRQVVDACQTNSRHLTFEEFWKSITYVDENRQGVDTTQTENRQTKKGDKEKEILSPDPNQKKKEINKEKEINLFPSSKDSSVEKPTDTTEEFDTDAFVVAWNTFFKNTHVSLIRALDSERKAMLKVRVKEYGKEDLKKAMQNYKTSRFFQENPQYANFGWFIRPRNFLKILEGNYNK